MGEAAGPRGLGPRRVRAIVLLATTVAAGGCATVAVDPFAAAGWPSPPGVGGARPAGAGPEPIEPPCFAGSAWPEADALFHRDRHWVGGDDAYSVDLGGGRTLWLFGDSWIDPSGQGRRGAASTMIRNSVAIQTGRDPSKAGMAFRWRRGPEGAPASFFPEAGKEWFWPGPGIRLGRRLVLFLARVRDATGGLGFDVYDWAVLRVENPDADPAAWRLTWLAAPRNPFGVLVGFGPILRRGRYVYAYATRENAHTAYLVRWPADAVAVGELGGMMWWGGPEAGWMPNALDRGRPLALFDAQSEFTVHRDRATGRYLALHTVGFGPADLALRAAASPEGPWSPARIVYRPPEYRRPGIMIYSAKAHTQLAGADLVATYATNTFDFGQQVADTTVYYPRFVRFRRCR